MQKKEIHLENLDQTKIFASRLAKIAKLSDIITFSGELGAGKTSFIQYFIQSLSDEIIEITSPTFNLLHIYKLKQLEIWHFDLYRLKSKEEAYELGIEDGFNRAISLIEWPEIIYDILPSNRLEIHLAFATEENARILTLIGFGKWSEIINNQLLLQEN